jgi:hypothetical protein
LNGLILIRLYSRIFLGKKDAEIQGYECDLSPWNAFAKLFAYAICNFLPLGLKYFLVR